MAGKSHDAMVSITLIFKPGMKRNKMYERRRKGRGKEEGRRAKG